MGLVPKSSTLHYGSVLVIRLSCCCTGLIVMMNKWANTLKHCFPVLGKNKLLMSMCSCFPAPVHAVVCAMLAAFWLQEFYTFTSVEAVLYWLLFSTASEAAFWLQEFYTFTSVKAIYIYCNDYCFPQLQKCQCYVAITAVSHSFRSTSALLQWLLFSTASEVPVLCCNDCCFPQLEKYQCSAVMTAVFHSLRSTSALL